MTKTDPTFATFRYLITNMDGVLWRGREPMPGLAEFFQFLRRHQIRFVCATNNASALPGILAERLQGWGADVHPEEIVTSSVATADYLADALPAGARLYVVGMEGLRVPLLQQGFEIAEDHVDAVVAGIDWHLTYDHLKRAALNIRAGARFIGTNGDRTFPSDRYKFRTSPLRNVAVQPTFMHNGAFTSLEDAIRHHLDPFASACAYTPASQNLDPDLAGPTGPIEPVLARLDPLLVQPVLLTSEQFRQLVAFVEHSLLDPRARPENLRRLVPRRLPSGRPTLVFEFPE